MRLTSLQDVPPFWVAAGNPARLLRKIETTMDPEHPSNHRTDGVYGAEKAMADLADELEVNNGQYDDADQGW